MSDNISSAVTAVPTLLSTNKSLSLASNSVDDLETWYIEAAVDLRVKETGLQNFHDELWQFIRARDALMDHPRFSGHLPETYYSGGALDPVGASA